MAEPKDEIREGEPVEEKLAEERIKAALSDELVQIFLSTRDAIVPGGVALEQQKLDLDAANAALSVMRKLLPETSIADIRRNILAVPLTRTIREQIAQSCPELALGFDDVQHHHVSWSIHGADGIDDGGFLREMVVSKVDVLCTGLTEEVCYELNRLEAEIKPYYPLNDDIGMAHLLYWILDGDIERVQTVIAAQIRSYRNVEQECGYATSDREVTVPPPPVFFRQLATFLKEYSYISKFLLDNSEHPNGMEERCRTGLAEVLRHPSLTIVRRSPEDPAVDLDQIHYELTTPSEATRSGEFVNPWFQGDLKQTPFDALKVSNILRMNMSYQEKARILLAINKYALEGDATTTLVQTQQAPKLRRRKPDPLPPEVLRLAKAFLALLHPKCIVKNHAVQLEFLNIVEELERDGRLRGDPELAHSISSLLHTQDPFLDIPIRQCRNKSIREIIMNLCFIHYSDEQIRDGLMVRGETVRLFPLPDAEGLLVPPDVPLSRYFNSAFLGVERGFVTDAAEAMASISSFQEVVHMAEKEAVRFFNAREAGGGRQYRFFYYFSAREAFEDVLAKYFPKFGEGDHAIVTNQEFSGITDIFRKQEERGGRQPEDAPDPGLRVVTLNDDQTRLPKTVDQLFKDISDQVDPEHTKIILLSSQTRLGDAPCVGKKKTSGTHLAELIRLLKRKYPDIPVAVDGCQTVGRARTDSLVKLGPDIYFTSGGKALGVGHVDIGSTMGIVALSQHFMGKSPSVGHQHSSNRYKGSMPKGNIAAMGLAMHMLRANVDLFRMEGNLGESRKFTLEQKIVQRMGELTQYTIQRAREYGDRFVNECLPSVAPQLLEQYSRDELVGLMGCRILYPAHRNKRDYSGIVTMDFPSKNARHMLPVLQEKPHKFSLDTCLFRNRALRISFHYLHEKADIDALFDAIRSVHAELIRLDRQQNKRLRDARYWTPR